ncbi:MAG: hypothetical protein MUO77_03355 [Anaerolineales bacterium]|nr:hypothetical protein [Anaerolineales bacterium]
MNAKKIFVISILLLFSLLAASCGGNQDTDVAVIVALTQTAMALEQQSALPTATSASMPQALAPSPTAGSVQPSATNTPPPYFGTVRGTISFPDSSVSVAWIYTVETSNSLWAKTAISNIGSASPYFFELAPGTYRIFAFPSGVGYSLDGKMLSVVTVTSGQTVSGVNLVAPTQTTCGPSFGVPAAPDGNFAAIAGASASCLSASQQDYSPMSAGDCSTLNAALSANTGVQGGVTPSIAFDDYVNSKSGSGCQINFVATGQTFSNFTGLSQPVEATLVSLGWQQDARYGAGGAGGYAIAYAKGKNLCLLVVESAPSDSSLCPGNEPFTVCWDRLAPEQKIFNLTLNCAQANFP